MVWGVHPTGRGTLLREGFVFQVQISFLFNENNVYYAWGCFFERGGPLESGVFIRRASRAESGVVYTNADYSQKKTI